ncbi:PDZ domain-containing protein [Bacillaceae bacterium SIJ1]|uniref:S41 family peptidase n=1 Tax=Litoribacterium kuwaitense TaxID=1398745 RepID=UPI0013EB84B2|nr:S41 family peptidase [Litoribacterium kuwaitense]NGP44957.1 PDZ domain-containing protein [Litoribacterium kuwaitense]
MRGTWKLAVFMALVFSVLIPQWTEAQDQSLEQVRTYVKDYYVDQVDPEILERDSIQSIMDGLDEYSVYLSPKDFSSFVGSIDRAISGIGVSVSPHEKGLEIVEVFKQTPAAEAGIKAGDILTTADGVTLEGKSSDEASSLLQGEPGTSLKVTVSREGTDETLTFTLFRAKISVPTVDYQVLGGDIGYFHLYSFNEQSANEMKAAMKAMGPVEQYIVDIRDNGGGYLNVAQEVAGLFPGVMEAVMTEDREGFQDLYFAAKQDQTFKPPVFLVINGQSASASEVLAAAVKEQGDGVLYGTNTFGKGTVQTIFPLDNGGVIKLTVARFYSPSGAPIDEVGVTPDVETAQGEELFKAHEDALLRQWDLEGEDITALQGSAGKAFLLHSDHPSNWSMMEEEEVSLVELGGDGVDVSLEPLSLKTAALLPKTSMQQETTYLIGVDEETASRVEITGELGPPTTLKAPFSDVKNDQYFTDAIRVLANETMVRGTGDARFRPHEKATRAEGAILLTRAMELTGQGKNSLFADVQKDDYYAPAVNGLVSEGVIQADAEHRFYPQKHLTRGEFAVWIQRAFNLQAGNDLPFTDVVANSTYGHAVSALYEASVIKGGSNQQFNPHQTVTRSDMAVMVYRALLLQTKDPDVQKITWMP